MPILDSFRASDFIEPAAIARPVVAYGVRFDSKGSELAPHQHRKAQIMLASRGVLACEAEGGVWIVPPGSALWVPGGVPHRVSAAGSVEGYSVFIEAQAFAALPAACCMMSVSPLLRELIVRCASYPAVAPEGGIEAHVATLLLLEAAASATERFFLPMPRDPRLRRIFDALAAAPANPGTLEDWAGRSAVSGRTLSRLVRAETGMSFGRWRQRIQVALSILRLAQGATVQAVALELGYESAGSFVTMFRKVIGTSPARFMAERLARDARGDTGLASG